MELFFIIYFSGTSDETDYSDLIGGEGEGQITEELTQLARPLKNNLGKLLAFSSEQLQVCKNWPFLWKIISENL